MTQAALHTPSDFESVSHCALCGSERRLLRFEEEPFSIVECADCGLVFVDPRLREEALSRVYGREYWQSECPSERGYADYVDDAPLYLKTFRKRFDFLKPFVGEPGRALDVGCAAGFFLKVLEERGWQCAGVELSPAIAAHARDVYGFENVHVGELASAPFAPGSFQLITMWDVVEHVPDPLALLGHAAELLAEDGCLVIETQNIASRFARLLGPRWQHFKHLEHLYHFQPDSLRDLLRRAGFEVIEATWRYAGKYVSLGFIRERATRVHPALAFFLRPFSALDGMSLYVNPGDEMIVIARKAANAGRR